VFLTAAAAAAAVAIAHEALAEDAVLERVLLRRVVGERVLVAAAAGRPGSQLPESASQAGASPIAGPPYVNRA